MHFNPAVPQPRTGCVVRPLRRRAGRPEGCGAAVRFPWHCQAPGLQPCCLSAPARLAERANVLLSGLHSYRCSCLQSPRNRSLPLSLPFPTSPLLLIRLALHGTHNTCAYPVKQAHSRRWIVSVAARNDTRKTSSLTDFLNIFLFFPHRKD